MNPVFLATGISLRGDSMTNMLIEEVHSENEYSWKRKMDRSNEDN